MSTVSTLDVLALARLRGVARLDALALVAHHWQKSRTWLVAHDLEPLPDWVWRCVEQDVAARTDGMPLAYLIGSKEFHGLSLTVNSHVLVPRPDTEVLVDWALALLAKRDPKAGRPVVVDLGTGSGAVALAIKHAYPAAMVHAVEASAPALALAQHNAKALKLEVHFHRGDWWDGGWCEELPGPIDLALSNPPYIAEADAHLPALRHEPQQALVAGASGLDDLQKIIRGAAPHLAPGGRLLLEHGHEQSPAVQDLLRRHGFGAVETHLDLTGTPRCSGGRVESPSA